MAIIKKWNKDQISFDEHPKTVNQIINKRIIEELENLRDEIQHDYDSLECLDDSDIGYGTCILRYIKEINNRIEELKEEINEH